VEIVFPQIVSQTYGARAQSDTGEFFFGTRHSLQIIFLTKLAVL
jgi:hypothetical protein